LNPIEIVASSPVSAFIAVSTVFVAIIHELALAAHRPAARRLARMMWGPFLFLLVLFVVVAIARIIWIFSE
jgi:hypothetical protein